MWCSLIAANLLVNKPTSLVSFNTAIGKVIAKKKWIFNIFATLRGSLSRS